MTRKSLLFGLILLALVMAACGGKVPGGAQGKEPVWQAATPAQKEAPSPSAAKGDQKAPGQPVAAAQVEFPLVAPLKTTGMPSAPKGASSDPLIPPLKVEPYTPEELALIDDCGFEGPEGITQDWALKALPVLLKSDWKTVPCYKKYTDEAEAREWFHDDIAMLISIVKTEKDEKVFDLTLQAVRARPDIGVFREAAMAFRQYPEHKNIIVPLLKEFMDVKYPKHPPAEDWMKIQVAHSLFIFGENDLALDYIEDLVKLGGESEHSTWAIPALFKCKEGDRWPLWDERGYKIIKEALNSQFNIIRAEASLYMARLGRDKVKAESVALDLFSSLMKSTVYDYGFDEKDHPYSINDPKDWVIGRDRLACDNAALALNELKSEKAIPLVEYVIAHNDGWKYVCQKNRIRTRFAVRDLSNGGQK